MIILEVGKLDVYRMHRYRIETGITATCEPDWDLLAIIDRRLAIINIILLFMILILFEGLLIYAIVFDSSQITFDCS